MPSTPASLRRAVLAAGALFAVGALQACASTTAPSTASQGPASSSEGALQRASTCDPVADAGRGCAIDEKVLPHGERYAFDDGQLQTCVCDDGALRCAPGTCPERAPQPLPEVGTPCERAGVTYPNGAEVPSGDTCNTCSCADGQVACTDAVCHP